MIGLASAEGCYKRGCTRRPANGYIIFRKFEDIKEEDELRRENLINKVIAAIELGYSMDTLNAMMSCGNCEKADQILTKARTAEVMVSRNYKECDALIRNCRKIITMRNQEKSA